MELDLESCAGESISGKPFTFRFACSHVICGECCSTLAKVAMEDSIAQRSGVKVTCPICRRPERVSVPAGVL